jgi:hypothetical protein
MGTLEEAGMNGDEVRRLFKESGLPVLDETGEDFAIPVGDRVVRVLPMGLATVVMTYIATIQTGDRHAVDAFLHEHEKGHPGKVVADKDGDVFLILDLPPAGLTPAALVSTVLLCAALAKECAERVRAHESALRIPIDWGAVARQSEGRRQGEEGQETGE